ncbi:MAG: AhpC/TSA family protein [Bacteroidales bacterium]|nr:AhpC/TSA family protein [Bacteroidales bacterium]
MRKNLFFILIIALGLVSCNKSFKVNLQCQNGEDAMAYLSKVTIDDIIPIDSTSISNGQAKLKAPLSDVQDLYLLVIEGLRDYILFLPENKDVTIVADIDNPAATNVTASEAQALLNTFNSQMSQKSEELYPAYLEAQKNNDESAAQSIVDELNDYKFNFIKNNSNNFASLYILNDMKQDCPLDTLKALVSNFGDTKSIYLDAINEYIDKQEKLEIGQPFIDFTLKTILGEDVKLSDIVSANKLTLVDFWASWCNPCRKENPNVLAAYNKYHKAGFEVLGVSVDQDDAEWMKAVRDDELIWTQVRDADNSASDLYSIYYIPSNFLIDQNGTIIAKGLRGEDLEAKLDELLK